MEPKPNFERVKKALTLQQPDRVPLAEVLISDEIKSKFLEKRGQRWGYAGPGRVLGKGRV